MKSLLELINKYCIGELSLFDFETKIINFQTDDNVDDLINMISEDIGYTTTGNLVKEDIKNSLISESELKNRLQEYIKRFKL